MIQLAALAVISTFCHLFGTEDMVSLNIIWRSYLKSSYTCSILIYTKVHSTREKVLGERTEGSSKLLLLRLYLGWYDR